APREICVICWRERYLVPSASFMSKLLCSTWTIPCFRESCVPLFRGSQTQYRVARELYGSILLLFPHRVPSHQSSSRRQPTLHLSLDRRKPMHRHTPRQVL